MILAASAIQPNPPSECPAGDGNALLITPDYKIADRTLVHHSTWWKQGLCVVSNWFPYLILQNNNFKKSTDDKTKQIFVGAVFGMTPHEAQESS